MTIITIHAVSPIVNVIRCHYGMDHLYESSRSIDFASYSCLFHGIIRYIFIAVGNVWVTSNVLSSVRIIYSDMAIWVCSRTAVAPIRASSLTAGVRECGAIYGLCCLGKCALVAWDCEVNADLNKWYVSKTVSLHSCVTRLPAELASE